MAAPIIAGNWKMYKTTTEATAFVRGLVASLSGFGRTEVVIAPPFVHLHALKGELGRMNLAAQNVSEEPEGAFTGEVSAPMLVDAGCTHVIIGHSERRTLFGETDARIARKLATALRYRMVPIFCIGETLSEREGGKTLDVVERQLRSGLQGAHGWTPDRFVIAYEPVWAIGTGKTATPEQAQEVHGAIRSLLGAEAGVEAARATRVLYGGSVKPDNIKDLISQPDIDGALVGGACLKIDSFTAIVSETDRAYATI